MEQHQGQRHNQTERVVASRGPAPRVLLAGRPGAGKGTQGLRLANRLGVQYLSTGDLLRREITAGSPLGRAVEDVVHAGELIPTVLIIAIVESCLDGDGYVLDGFPRTVEQAVAVTSHPGLEPHVAIEIVVPAQTALARLTERGRTDDDINVARRRLAVYETETVPMLSYLHGHGLLRSVNGDGPPDIVEQNVWKKSLLIAEPSRLSSRPGVSTWSHHACHPVCPTRLCSQPGSTGHRRSIGTSAEPV